MAKINPRDITIQTECYAAVEMDLGFRCGRLKGWKLYDLKNPDLCMTLSQSPSEIIAAFETQEELMQWRADIQRGPEPELKKNESPTLFDVLNEQPEQEIQPKTVGKSIEEILIDGFGDNPPKDYAAAAQWLQGKLRHYPESMWLKWVKPLRDVDTLLKRFGMQLTTFYLHNNLRTEFDYLTFVDSVAMLCVSFYQFNGGEMDAETRYFLEKNKMEFGFGDDEPEPQEEIKLVTIGSGPNKLIISQIL